MSQNAYRIKNMKFWAGSKLFWGLTLVFLLSQPLGAAKKSPLQENVTLTLVVSGDVSGTFELSGAIGEWMEAESDPPPAAGSDKICSVLMQVRKIFLNKEVALEAWPQLKCTIQGQKKLYKLHRQYLKLTDEIQKKKIQGLDLSLMSIELEFRDLSLQKSKR